MFVLIVSSLQGFLALPIVVHERLLPAIVTYFLFLIDVSFINAMGNSLFR